jgi:very-short-patch-repair endonuclease
MQFKQSFLSFQERNKFPSCPSPQAEGSSDFSATMSDNLLSQSARLDIPELIKSLESASESPIEYAMAGALILAAREKVPYVVYGQQFIKQWWTNGTKSICFYPQARLGKHRVDLLIIYRDSPDSSWERAVIVECDGHDFHERTSEQAGKDKKRDRDLQALGYPVFRFTGSEIWKDMFGCASEVLAALMDPKRPPTSAAQPLPKAA